MTGKDPWPDLGYRGESEPAPSRRRKRRGGDAPSDDGRPVIQIRQGEISRAVEEAEAALLALPGPPRLYQRGGAIVHIARRPVRRSDGTREEHASIAPAEPAAIAAAMAEAARFEKFDGRSQDWRPSDVPPRAVDNFLARPRNNLPDLRQIVAAPMVWHDGTMIGQPGYDARSGLFLTDAAPQVRVAESPKARDAEAANERLVALFESFPFTQDVPGVDLAVALAALLTMLQRPALSAAPMFLFTSPTPGSGKTFLADTISMAATGSRAAAVATGARVEEFEKVLGSELMAGRPAILMDNLSGTLAGSLIAMAITSEQVNIRLLGASRTIACPTSVTLMATGNNVNVSPDLARRVLIARLDPRVERPEDRRFDGDPLAEARSQRAEIVAAALTIVRWGLRSRDPAPQGARGFAGFDGWARMVRDPLMRLGHADAVAALDETRAADGETMRLRELVAQWARYFDDDPKICSDAVTSADTDLMAALVAATGDRAGAINSRRLTNYLTRVEGRVVAGRAFKRAGKKEKTTAWVLERVPGKRGEQE